jgi:hypothetical protein
LARRPIEPISYQIRAWVPLGKAQRIEEVTYDPLLYLARLTLLSGAPGQMLYLSSAVPLTINASPETWQKTSQTGPASA